ncbi:site-specific DNA-methyltransferase [Streptobacillus ratti]|uniref:site-specific DNA-methyltransferase n=2 Tax=Streptobacillus ratti TaxID=1720557 RepID=UPI0009332134
MSKLELTWIGKEEKIKVEPRILIENPELSNIKNDSNTENMIIHGDNLLVLKALEKEYTGKIKCIYIDPPYNTGSAFEHYDDNLEHSTWLNLMKPRLEILRNLLSDDGSIWISIDADESHYLKVLCDELFGRNNFVDEVIWQRSYSPINLKKTLSRSHDTILVYAKNKTADFSLNKLPRSAEANSRYSNPDNDSRGVWKSSDLSVGPAIERNIYEITTPSGRKVMPPSGYSWRLSKERFAEFVEDNRIWFGEMGNNVPSIKRFLSEVKDGVVAMTLWHLSDVGHTQDAKKEIKALELGSVFDTPKQERLIERILTLATNENDLVLDSFLGSGTTCAVAQKMNRRYIGIEMGEHAYTHCKVRMDKVIDGDQGGISIKKEVFALENSELAKLDFDVNDIKIFNKVLDKLGKETEIIPKELLCGIKNMTKVTKIKSESVWQGGGAYRFYELAPTLITRDFFDEEIINPDYNPEMLSAAVALHEGYHYKPSSEIFWKQSYGSENSYLFVTTNHIDSAYVSKIKETMEEKEFLLIACQSFEERATHLFKNIKIKKIPNTLLENCEFGKENYNLNIICPPQYEEEE